MSGCWGCSPKGADEAEGIDAREGADGEGGEADADDDSVESVPGVARERPEAVGAEVDGELEGEDDGEAGLEGVENRGGGHRLRSSDGRGGALELGQEHIARKQRKMAAGAGGDGGLESWAVVEGPEAALHFSEANGVGLASRLLACCAHGLQPFFACRFCGGVQIICLATDVAAFCCLHLYNVEASPGDLVDDQQEWEVSLF